MVQALNTTTAISATKSFIKCSFRVNEDSWFAGQNDLLRLVCGLTHYRCRTFRLRICQVSPSAIPKTLRANANMAVLMRMTVL